MKIDEHLLIFELSAGGVIEDPSTFMQLVPLKSLSDVETWEAAHRGEDTPEMIEVMKDAKENEEVQYFCVNQEASYTSGAGPNRNFWAAALKK